MDLLARARAALGNLRTVLVATSGGLDSTVLLDVLHGVTLADGPSLGAAYLDHGLRGETSRRDGDLVGALCARRGIPFYRGSVDVRSLARQTRRSLEAAGREARYAFLADVARREGFAAVATAHHADDQVETLLLRLERGGREEGRAGIRPATRIAGVLVLRPLLAVPRTELVAWAETRRLPFREDATNADLGLERNRLRALAAPHVAREDAAALTRLAGLRLRLLDAAGDAVEGALLGELRRSRDDGAGTAEAVELPARPLAALDAALRRELLRRAFHRVAPSSVPLPERALDQLERVVVSRMGGAVWLRDTRARVSCGCLRFEGGTGRESDLREEWQPGAEHIELFDPSAIEGALRLRTPEPGDRLELAYGRKKLKELFREARVPVWDRGRYPVVADDRGAVWVVGLARGVRGLARSSGPALWVRVRTGSPGPPRMEVRRVRVPEEVGSRKASAAARRPPVADQVDLVLAPETA